MKFNKILKILIYFSLKNDSYYKNDYFKENSREKTSKS